MGPTKLKGKGTLSGSLVENCARVAEITKPLASVDEIINSGMMVSMHKTGEIAKRLDLEVEKENQGLREGRGGSEVILERAEGPSTFEVDQKSEEGGKFQIPRKTAKANQLRMDFS